MTPPTDPAPEPRIPLNKERVLRAAVALADEHGVDALTMRKLAQALGVEAMSLYNHVRNKDEILDGLVDAFIQEIDPPPGAPDWKTSMRRRAMAARAVVQRHPWASALIVSRFSMSMPMLQYMDATLKTLREGGFSLEMAHHAMHALGSRILGFTQELVETEDTGNEMKEAFLRQFGDDEFPYIAEMISEIEHDDQEEFEFGLDLILDGLERCRA